MRQFLRRCYGGVTGICTFKEKLNELFLKNPTVEDLLELEFLSGGRKETAVYIRTHIDYNSMDTDRFGRELFGLLKPIYKSKDIHEFGDAVFLISIVPTNGK